MLPLSAELLLFGSRLTFLFYVRDFFILLFFIIIIHNIVRLLLFYFFSCNIFIRTKYALL